jgi:hypothetical protein
MVHATIRGVGDALIRKTSPVVRSRREGVGLELFRRALCVLRYDPSTSILTTADAE